MSIFVSPFWQALFGVSIFVSPFWQALFGGSIFGESFFHHSIFGESILGVRPFLMSSFLAGFSFLAGPF